MREFRGLAFMAEPAQLGDLPYDRIGGRGDIGPRRAVERLPAGTAIIEYCHKNKCSPRGDPGIDLDGAFQVWRLVS